jgi:hypothetical protein
MTVFAHAGHWAVDIGIYLGPLLVIALGLFIADRREKRKRRREREGGGAAPG